MKFDDIKRDLLAIRQTITSAQLHFQNRQYEECQKELSEILELIEISLPEDHPDYSLSLQLLGDSHFAQKQYSQSAQYFEQCLKLQSKHASLKSSSQDLPLRLKLAQSLDRAGRPKEALVQYEWLTTECFAAICVNHTLKEMLLTNYEQCLRRLGKSPRDCKSILQKLRQDRSSKMSLETDTHKNKDLDGKQQLELKELTEFLASETQTGKRLRQIDEGMPKSEGLLKRALGLTVILSILAMGGGLIVFLKDKIGPIQTNVKPIETLVKSKLATKLAGKSFSSLDKAMTIEFDNNSEAKLTDHDGSTIKVKCFDFKTIPSVLAGTVSNFVLEDGLLISPTGQYLYPQQSLDSIMVARAQDLSLTLQNYYRTNSEYPDDIEKLRTLLQAKPDIAGSLQITYLGRMKDTGDRQSQIEKLKKATFITQEAPQAGQILCYYALSGNASNGLKCSFFAVRASGSKPMILAKNKNNDSFLITLQEGKTTEIYQGQDVEQSATAHQKAASNTSVRAVSLEENR